MPHGAAIDRAPAAARARPDADRSRRRCALLERLAGDRALATWDEVELMEVSMVPADGHGDAQRLGVAPRSMAAVLGVS